MMDIRILVAALLVTIVQWLARAFWREREGGQWDQERREQFLTVLADGTPRSGFEIATALAGDDHDHLLAMGPLYLVLSRLERDQMVTCKRLPHPQRSDLWRFEYSITPRGRVALTAFAHRGIKEQL